MATSNNVSADQVSQLYQDVFGRLPDSNGLNFWQTSGLAAPQMKQEFLQSPEYGAGVSNLYRSVLGRQPDAAGQMYWQTSGVGLPDMAQHFQNSSEYVNDGSYQSNLIASLRAANSDPMTNNTGVDLLDNPENSKLTLNFNKPVPTGLSNRPQKLEIKPTTPTPLAPDTPVGGGGGDGGGSGGGTGGGGDPIIIDPFDPVVDDNTGTDDGSDDSWSEWDDYTDTGDDSVTDDDSWSEWDDYTDTGDDQDTSTGGNDSLNADDTVDSTDNYDANADEIAELYRDILNRDPDEDGLEFWDETGLSADQIADYFRGSDEYASLSDAADVPDYTNDLWGDDIVDDVTTSDADADAIAQLYRDYFGREPDQAGLDWWDQTGLGVDDIAAIFGDKGEHAPISVDPGIPDYTDDFWADDNLGVNDDLADVPDYTDDLWGDDLTDYITINFGGGDLYDPIFGFDGFDAGGFSGGGGGGGGGMPWDEGFVVLVSK